MNITLNRNGFFFFNNGRFFNPGNLPNNYHVLGYELANQYVQVLNLGDKCCLKLVKRNLPPNTGNYNVDYYLNNPWKYSNSPYEVGSFYNPTPSGILIHGKKRYLRVYDLNPKVAINFFSNATVQTNNNNLLQLGTLLYFYTPKEKKIVTLKAA